MATIRPEVGDILHVVHDFIARSSDELSLAKGDRVELIERDDEFGDGWFLGRHMANGNTGLFPEVYTRAPPKGAVIASPAVQKPPVAKAPTSSNGLVSSFGQGASTGSGRFPSAGANQLPPVITEQRSLSMPANSIKQESTPTSTLRASPGTLGSSSANRPLTQDSHVLHETLTVIDEHITDLHSTPSNSNLHASNDSGSEYSSQMPERMSYIQGEETDEEDDDMHTRQEVVAWTPDQVAEYLFTTGVEKQHCEVFRDQEISGEIILGMDQSSLFLKAFDLGSVGRRLKTWQKIKNLQDEVNGIPMDRRNSRSQSDAGSEDSRVRIRSRTNTLTSSMQRLPPITDRPGSRRYSQTPKMDPITSLTPGSPRGLEDSTRPSNHQKRPSAASIRDLHHSRRHSSTGYAAVLTGSNGAPRLGAAGTFPLAEGGHRKQPSFDRNWTMGDAATSSVPGRPLSSTGMHDLHGGSDIDPREKATNDQDRGYFSGGEVDNKKRNVLKKRDSVSHSPQASYTEQQRMRAATTSVNRTSRYGSMDASQLDSTPIAAHKHFGLSDDHRRNASSTTTSSVPPRPPTKDGPSPIVTRLDGLETTSKNDWFSKPAAHLSNLSGLRAISDSVTRTDRTRLASPTESSLKDSPRSSTPSAGPSFDFDSPDAAGKSPLSSATTGSRKPIKTKAKKETSAYTRGLQKIGPREAIKDADYSGWMKKKSSHLMTTWKPRLFVLRGRRLSYYYSEEDTEEKGLIDISFHRVLPADNERLQGLHATLTGASTTPVPADSSIETTADAASATAVTEKGPDTMFMFKLVPPRAGLNKAVTFTKPMVHYFALPNLQQGRMWMAALMKATIDRDDTQPMTSTYQQKTISLTKARQMRHRPPALMGLEDKSADGTTGDGNSEQKDDALGIAYGDLDSAVSGVEKLGFSKLESSSAMKATFDEKTDNGLAPLTAANVPQSA
ncbi:SAM domain (Sterile alpha motif) [Microdochium nivale]|nr:SAM domain (Sterile alpha motif) [Microdochium nivale]